MKIDRVFIDTNILLSGLLFEGNESQLLELALEGKLRLLLADVVIDEAKQVLSRKFPKHVQTLDAFLAVVDYEAVPRPSGEATEAATRLLRDPADADVLASMQAASPDVALTGDNDLLTSEVRATAPVSRCADYLRKLLHHRD